MKSDKKYAQEIVSEVRKDYESRREKRKSLELQWRLNMNFVAGDQYCEITPVGDVEDYGKQYYWQQREVFNHLASIVETRLAKLSRVKTGVSVRPFSNADNDIQTAKLSTQVLKAVCEENNLVSLVNTAAAWSEVTGSCFLKVGWDSDKGSVIGKDDKGRDIREGDIAVSVVPPFEIFPDNVLCNDLSECRSVIHAKAYHVSEVKDLWDADVQGEEINVFSLDSSPLSGGEGYTAGIASVTSGTAPDHCIVIERYCLPTKEYPSGRLTIVAGDKLLFDGDLPYVNGSDGSRTYPFSRMICLDKVGCVFGTSVVERLIPLQRAYNAVRNRKHEFLNRIAMGVLAVEDGSVDVDNLEEEGLAPGKILTYRQGSNPPRMMDAGNVPSDFKSEEDRILSEFITISGVSELSKYSQTYSSMSGTAISLLVEQDDTRLASTSNSMRECIRNVSGQILRLYKQFAGEKRLKRIAGEEGQLQYACFSASQLQSEDLVFETDNELTDTLANRRNMVLELVRMGVLQDKDGSMSERNKARVLELLGFGNWENAADISDCQRDAAIKENMSAQSGKSKLSVCEVDDHEIHIAEHVKAILTGGSGDAYREKMLEHIREHRMYAGMIAAAGQAGGENTQTGE